MKRALAIGLSNRTLVVALTVVLIAGPAAVTYELSTLASPALIVTDGSIVGVIEGDFANLTSTLNPLVLNFTATTYANQSGHLSSTLVMRVQVMAATWGSPGANGTYLDVILVVSVVGRFAPNLHPMALALTANQTAATATGWDAHFDSLGGQEGTNVSFNPEQYVAIAGTGSGTLGANPVNEAGNRPYVFAYSNRFEGEEQWYWYNHFIGFRATVTGPFTPAVAVGILLPIIDV